MRFDALNQLPRARHTRRADADFTAFAAQSLLQVVTTTYDQRYLDLDAKTNIPTGANGINAAAMAWAFDSWSGRGSARLIGANVDDIPRVDVGIERKPLPIKTGADAYGYSLEEFEAAQYAGVPLSTRKASQARRSLEELQNQILYFGSAPEGLPGLLTNPSIPVVVAPTGNWLSGTLTAGQFVADLMALGDAVWLATNMIQRPDTVGVPLAHYRVAQTIVMPNTTITALQFFLSSNGFVKNIVPIRELATAGPGGTPRAIAYAKDPDILAGIEPLPFSQLDPQVRGLETTVICRLRTGGTAVFYPESVAFLDGI